MSIDTELQRALQQLIKRDTPTLSVQVVSVNTDNGTCRVLEDGLEFEVRLSSVISPTRERCYLFPKVGSEVLIAPIEEDVHRYHVIGYSEIEAVQCVIDGVEFIMDKDGFILKKNEINFKQLLNDFLTEMKNAVIQTPSGVGNFAPNVKAKLQELNDKVNQLFK